MRTVVRENLGLVMTVTGGLAGVIVAAGLLGRAGVGGAAVVGSTIGAAVGMRVTVRAGGAR